MHVFFIITIPMTRGVGVWKVPEARQRNCRKSAGPSWTSAAGLGSELPEVGRMPDMSIQFCVKQRDRFSPCVV